MKPLKIVLIQLFLSIFIFGFLISQNREGEDFETEINKLLRDLGSRYYDTRVKAKKEIMKIGVASEPFVITALENENRTHIKLLYIEILGSFQTKLSMKKLIDEFCRTNEVEIEDAIENTFINLKIGFKSTYEDLFETLNNPEFKLISDKKNKIVKILREYLNKYLESFFDELVKTTAGYIVYNGAFDILKKFDRKMVIEYLQNKNIPPVKTLKKTESIPPLLVISLDALAELVTPSDRNLNSYLKKYIGFKELKEQVSYALWKLGEKSYYEELIQEEEKKTNNSILPFLYYRLGDYVKAKKSYLEILSHKNNRIEDSEKGKYYYYLACACSKIGEIEDAIQYLKNSVEWFAKDPKEVSYIENISVIIEKDKDLQNLRNNTELYDKIKELLKNMNPAGERTR